ncbi:monooxygenase [Brevibacillus sp. SYSU BS000544]|uniref:monooxygenase n=1 Tax=Brevibacillus sp. SYSU BS000544 TaxID=3416443 RepID=UPI003CE55865
MTQKLLQIDFKMEGPWGQQMAAEFEGLANMISHKEGLLWKIWAENEQTKESGGIYLFVDQAACERYLEEHMPRLQSFGITDIRAKIFDVNEALTKITRGIL